jgi:hypothetical protein
MIFVNRRFSLAKLIGKRRRLGRRAILCLAFLLGLPVAGQSPYFQFPSTNSGKNGRNYPENSVQFGPESAPDPKRVRMLNAERQKSIISDTEKLFKLAKELNDEMAAVDSPVMTDAQMRKLNEIQKLARSVKEKMSFTTGGPPALSPPVNFGNQ